MASTKVHATPSAETAPAALPYAGYVRVSRKNGRKGDSFISPELQEASIKKTARQHGVTLSEIVTELDVSGGKKMEERELGRLVQDVIDGKLGGVIVWNVKRYSRDWADGMEAFDSILKADGDGRLLAEDFSHTGMFARTMLSALLEIAEDERRQRTEGWDNTLAGLIERGIHSGNVSRPPMGYEWPLDAKGKKAGPMIKTKDAPLVKRTLEAFGHKDESKRIAGREAAKRLGVTLNAFLWMARSEAYVGTAYWKTHRKEGAHPALISRECFDRIAARFASQAAAFDTPERRAPATLRPLTKIVRCAESGRVMSYDKATKLWRCAAGKRSKADCTCGGQGIPNSVVLDRVISEAVRWHAFNAPLAQLGAAVDDAMLPALESAVQAAQEALAAAEAEEGCALPNGKKAQAVEAARQDLRAHRATRGWIARSMEEVETMISGGAVEEVNAFLRETLTVSVSKCGKHATAEARSFDSRCIIAFLLATDANPDTRYEGKPAALAARAEAGLHDAEHVVASEVEIAALARVKS